MSLVLASMVPNLPSLIEEIGKNDYKNLKETNTSLQNLKEELAQLKPDTLIVISCNENKMNKLFSIYQNPIYYFNFEKFGNFNLKSQKKGNIGLTHQIREALETKTELQMLDSEQLEYNFGVPLHILAKDLPDTNIIPINCADLDLNEHIKFGKIIKREILLRKSKIAIVAAGNIEQKKPTEQSEDLSNINGELIDYLTNKTEKDKNNEFLNNFSKSEIKPFLILKGILSEINFKSKILSSKDFNDKKLLVSKFNF